MSQKLDESYVDLATAQGILKGSTTVDELNGIRDKLKVHVKTFSDPGRFIRPEHLAALKECKRLLRVRIDQSGRGVAT